jgi:hypothetical protein
LIFLTLRPIRKYGHDSFAIICIDVAAHNCIVFGRGNFAAEELAAVRTVGENPLYYVQVTLFGRDVSVE